MKMLITDLDNTLYDWISFFTKSFQAMVAELSIQTNVDKCQLLKEFKNVHQKYRNTELPYAIFEIPTVKRLYPNLSRKRLVEVLDKPLHAFNSARKQHLKTYESVESTLEYLVSKGFKIIGHTEAIMENGFYRLQKLDIDKFFSKLYVLEGETIGHPNPKRKKELEPKEGFVEKLPIEEKKPNPDVLLDICFREGALVENTWYVGDSLIKDILMANKAGVKSIWARYGSNYDRNLWDYLVKVSHWTPQDVKQEAILREKNNEIEPDFIIDAFSEIIQIVNY